MFFNVDADKGSVISGWFAPDNPVASPRIIVVIPGRGEIEIEATLQRNDVRDLGIHGTGRIGFRIDRSIVEDIDRLADVQLLEAETRLPFYRRFLPERHIERKLFLFDAALMPQHRLIANIRNHFGLTYFASERLSLETLIGVINNNKAKSLFITGRSNYQRYASYMEGAGFMKAAIVRDPFEELAERFLFLHVLLKSQNADFASNFVTGATALLELARDLPINDDKALRVRFRQLTLEERQAISNPTTRMLGCGVDEPCERRSVSIALENLARMDVVGSRHRHSDFRALLAQALGTDILEDEPSQFETVRGFAATLSRIGPVADLLEHDLALYSYAKEAIDAGIDQRDLGLVRDTQTM